ncbi:MAG: 30S ribosomal protein S24e [Thermoplasmata archaeon]
MEISIVEERPNPLLKRTEYRFEIQHASAATPSRDAVRAELAKSVKAPKERVVIEQMRSKFGTSRTIGEAAVYQTVDDAKTIVRAHILVRNRIIEKATKTEGEGPAATPAAAAPAAATAGEAPAAEAPSAAAPKREAPKDIAKEEAPKGAPKADAVKKDAPRKDAPKKEA